MIIKLAPVLGMSNFAGIMTMMVGGITFLFASCAAISQVNAKRVLAYSTIAPSSQLLNGICAAFVIPANAKNAAGIATRSP